MYCVRVGRGRWFSANNTRALGEIAEDFVPIGRDGLGIEQGDARCITSRAGAQKRGPLPQYCSTDGLRHVEAATERLGECAVGTRRRVTTVTLTVGTRRRCLG